MPTSTLWCAELSLDRIFADADSLHLGVSQVYYHRVGTRQSEDILVHKDEAHSEWMFGAGGTEE